MDEALDGLWRNPTARTSSDAPLLQKTSTVGGPVTCVSLPNDEICCYAQGSYLERVAVNLHLASQANNEKGAQSLQDRVAVFDDGTLLHGIRHQPSSPSSSSSTSTTSNDDGGFDQENSYTAIFGGRQIAILSNALVADRPMKKAVLLVSATATGKEEVAQQRTTTTLQFSDWIWDVRWMPPSANDDTTPTNADNKHANMWKLLVGLAHNTVEQWSFCPHKARGENVLEVTKTQCWRGTKRCLLYCLDFQVNGAFTCNSASAQVAVGTAMQDIRIWTLPQITPLEQQQLQRSALEENSTDKTVVIPEDACLLGHQGVIHGVKWVPSSLSLQLVSASDDRSVRLWGQQPQPKESHLQLTQEWQCLWIGWGHTARIWGLGVITTAQQRQLTPSSSSSPFAVVSSGEDNTVRLWNGQTGNAVGTMRGHPCQCIWSVDVNDKHGLVVSGGNDGTIALYDVSDAITEKVQNRSGTSGENGMEEPMCLLVPDDRPKAENTKTVAPKVELSQPIQGNLRKKKKNKKDDTDQVLVGMKFFTPHHLLVATRSGSLFALDTRIHPPAWVYLGSWALPLSNEKSVDPSTACTMACHVKETGDGKGGKLLEVAIGTTRGLIVALLIALEALSSCPVVRDDDHHFSVAEPKAIGYRLVLMAPDKYRAVHWLAWRSTEHEHNNQQGLFSGILSFHINTVLWWSSAAMNSNNTSSSSSAVTSLDRPSWIFDLGTQAIPISFAFDEIYQRLFVGDTRGNLVMFDANEVGSLYDDQEQKFSLAPSAALYRLHQKEHVTDIVVVAGACSSSPRRILSVGNDGCVQESYYDPTGNSLQRGLSVTASSSLTGISRISVINNLSREDVIVAGYFGNTYVLLNVSRGYELFRADTGGRQRQHDFFSSQMPCKSSANAAGNKSDSYLGRLAVCVHRKQDGRNEVVLHTKQTLKNSFLWQKQKYAVGVGLHGESMYSACFFTLRAKSGVQCQALLTGSEDCTSKIAFYSNGTFVAAKQLPAQESCVRSVCSSSNDNGAGTLLAVGGGKLTLQFFLVRYESQPGDPNAIDAKSRCSYNDALIQVHFLGYGKTRKKALIDHRINDVKAVLLEDDRDGDRGERNGGRLALEHLVVAGDSEGNCYIYKVSTDLIKKQHSWTGLPLLQENSSSKPILSVELLKVRSRVLLLTGTTGGEVTIWDLPASSNAREWDSLMSKPDLTESNGFFPATRIGYYHPHQMGVNSISATLEESRETVLVCSGGDDQAISMCELRVGFDESKTCMISAEVLKLSTTREASSSAVKGVQILSRDHVVSTGYSQRLALWKNCGGEGLKLALSIPVSVGDVNCFASTLSSDRGSEYIVAVGGAGVDLFSLTEPSTLAARSAIKIHEQRDRNTFK